MPGAKYSGGYLYDKTGNTLIYEFDDSTETVQQVLNSQEATAANVSEVSNTIGGQSLSGSVSLEDYRELMSGKTSLYDVTPEPETITGFYLDGQEYVLGGSGTEYNAGEGIEIKNGPDYSAMQGPAPDGFHVPLNTEWKAVRDIRVALGGGSSAGTNFGIALKLPFAGCRYYSSANVSGQSSYGYYWSSSRYNTNSAYSLYFSSSALSPQDTYDRAYGFSVRCFKNSPTVPTSSWTKLYGTSIEAGGIFWSSTDGLISLSSDGNTWITIADKNLGATTVWNSGDTLSETNAGKYYQRGNNYGFAWTGTVTTSSTQVDASNYGPGNYYSSSTFIKRSSSPYRWDSTDNANLWGGETGVVTFNNVITNTGVLSVNGQTGDINNVVIGDSQYMIKVSNSAPASGTPNTTITFVTGS